MIVHATEPSDREAEPSGLRPLAWADTLPDLRPAPDLREPDALEDTQPSVVLPEAGAEDFDSVPTLPGSAFRLHELLRDVPGPYEPPSNALRRNERAAPRDTQWERALDAVARVVRRVFAAHSL
jgi:hypothetical protein